MEESQRERSLLHIPNSSVTGTGSWGGSTTGIQDKETQQEPIQRDESESQVHSDVGVSALVRGEGIFHWKSTGSGSSTTWGSQGIPSALQFHLGAVAVPLER